jgi:5'-deoxynucleotidase YfbR-like HD superfamily hydrolase
MTSPYIRVKSGKKFHVLSPKPCEIEISDIAHALSHLCRFTGHCSEFYSVAQHSCHVSDILPDDLKLIGLLHDASEAYCNDIASPLKKTLPQYIDVENNIQKVICRRFKLIYPYPAAIKTADRVLLATELRDLIGHNDHKIIPLKPLDKKIKAWSTAKSRTEFLKRFNVLTKKIAENNLQKRINQLS